MADKKIEVDAATTIEELLASLKHDGERIHVAIKGQPIVLAIHRERATDHLSIDEKMKLVQAAFTDAPSEIATFDSELERFKSPLDYE